MLLFQFIQQELTKAFCLIQLVLQGSLLTGSPIFDREKDLRPDRSFIHKCPFSKHRIDLKLNDCLSADLDEFFLNDIVCSRILKTLSLSRIRGNQYTSTPTRSNYLRNHPNLATSKKTACILCVKNCFGKSARW